MKAKLVLYLLVCSSICIFYPKSLLSLDSIPFNFIYYVFAGKIEFIPGGNWWPDDPSIVHRFAMPIQGHGLYPNITVTYSNLPEMTLHFGNYSIFVNEAVGTVSYDVDSRLVRFSMRYPYTYMMLNPYPSGIGPFEPFDETKCLQDKGETETILLAKGWEDPNDRISLSWKPFGDDEIQFNIKGDTGGWMALGFADSANSMGPGDAIMCEFKGGEVIVEDRYITSPGQTPIKDPQQGTLRLLRALGGIDMSE